MCCFFFFFFQAEDGIRDFHVTGVQTCALPICRRWLPDRVAVAVHLPGQRRVQVEVALPEEDPLGGVDPAGVAVRRLRARGGLPGVPESVEVRDLAATLCRRLRHPERRAADAAEADGVVTRTVHHDGVEVDELAEGSQTVS